jgi:hypothetical protein
MKVSQNLQGIFILFLLVTLAINLRASAQTAPTSPELLGNPGDSSTINGSGTNTSADNSSEDGWTPYLSYMVKAHFKKETKETLNHMGYLQ